MTITEVTNNKIVCDYGNDRIVDYSLGEDAEIITKGGEERTGTIECIQDGDIHICNHNYNVISIIKIDSIADIN